MQKYFFTGVIDVIGHRAGLAVASFIPQDSDVKGPAASIVGYGIAELLRHFCHLNSCEQTWYQALYIGALNGLSLYSATTAAITLNNFDWGILGSYSECGILGSIGAVGGVTALGIASRIKSSRAGSGWKFFAAGSLAAVAATVLSHRMTRLRLRNPLPLELIGQFVAFAFKSDCTAARVLTMVAAAVTLDESTAEIRGYAIKETNGSTFRLNLQHRFFHPDASGKHFLLLDGKSVTANVVFGTTDMLRRARSLINVDKPDSIHQWDSTGKVRVVSSLAQMREARAMGFLFTLGDATRVFLVSTPRNPGAFALVSAFTLDAVAEQVTNFGFVRVAEALETISGHLATDEATDLPAALVPRVAAVPAPAE